MPRHRIPCFPSSFRRAREPGTHWPRWACVDRAVCGSAAGSAEYVYEFDQARLVIGRGGSADVRLPDVAVSERHATIQVQGSTYVVQDEQSTNGTWLRGAALIPGRPKPLRNGDMLQIAGYDIEFHGSVP